MAKLGEAIDIEAFQDKLGYKFTNQKLLKEALTHPSYANASGLSSHNQRLEFLGDAVLELVTSEFIYRENKGLDEGDLTKLRSKLVRKDSLCRWAKEIGLYDAVLVGKSLKNEGVTDSIAADAMEAVFGAVFLDRGYYLAKQTIEPFLQASIARALPEERDPKTTLQEMMQAKGLGVPHYKTIERKGPDHALRFKVQVTLGNKILAEAWGDSVKAAEFTAAKDVLSKNESK
jgi:ribonuclease-3